MIRVSNVPKAFDDSVAVGDRLYRRTYNCDPEGFVGQRLRFELVASSGGNTGAKEIDVK